MGIPTARFADVNTRKPISDTAFGFPCFVKADSLAYGKGIKQFDSFTDAQAGMHQRAPRTFSEHLERVLIERSMSGTA